MMFETKSADTMWEKNLKLLEEVRWNRDRDRVQALLREGADINARDENLDTLLLIAVQFDKIMEPDINRKVYQFETFINDVLRQDLTELEKKLDEKNAEIAEFLQLKSVINTLKNTGADKDGFKTKVDVGNNFFIQAKVEHASHILLDVGLGYFVEFTLDEALTLIDVRIKLFERQVVNLRKEIARTNAHIKLILIGIRDLQGMN